jgi:hypothetical protein
VDSEVQAGSCVDAVSLADSSRARGHERVQRDQLGRRVERLGRRVERDAPVVAPDCFEIGDQSGCTESCFGITTPG